MGDTLWDTWDGWKIELSVELPDKGDTLSVRSTVHPNVPPGEWISPIMGNLEWALRRQFENRGLL